MGRHISGEFESRLFGIWLMPLLSKAACVGQNANCQGQWLWLMRLLFGFLT